MSKIYDELKRAEYSRNVCNIVSAGICVDGEICGNEDLLVEGLVEGLIQLGEGILTVAATGRVAADVIAREVVVYGEMRGNIAARDRVEIRRGGCIVGDAMTARFVIDDGADFRGLMEITSREKSSYVSPETTISTNSTADEQHTRAFTAAG